MISGNTGDGVVLTDDGTSNNVVTGDYIGTDVHGAKAVANGGNGVTIKNTASSNTVGAKAPAMGPDTTVTVISGNTNAGVAILSGSSNNQVLNSYIGTDVSGTKNIGNLLYGIDLEGDTNTIGGLVNSTNVISGNGTGTWKATSGFGIYITGAGAKNNVIEGDYIGTTLTGNAGLGNVNSGIYFCELGHGQHHRRHGRRRHECHLGQRDQRRGSRRLRGGIPRLDRQHGAR